MTAVKGSPDAGPDALAMAQRRLHDAAPALLVALVKLSNEVLGSLPLMEALARRELGNTNYNILMQRAAEARAVIARTTNPVTTAITSGRAPTMEEVADVVGKGERP